MSSKGIYFQCDEGRVQHAGGGQLRSDQEDVRDDGQGWRQQDHREGVHQSQPRGPGAHQDAVMQKLTDTWEENYTIIIFFKTSLKTTHKLIDMK